MRYPERSEAFKSKLWADVLDELTRRGFSSQYGRYFECLKTVPRREVRVTAYAKYVELYVREYPQAEGWFDKYPWTQKGVVRLLERCAWW